MANETVEGWSNRPTWCVNMWLANDRKLNAEALARAAGALKAAPYVENVPGWSLDAVAFLARDLKEWVETDLAPDLGNTFAADLLGYALAEVDWYELAEEWIGKAADEVPV